MDGPQVYEKVLNLTNQENTNGNNNEQGVVYLGG
jgi:hypothetical protein